MWGEGGEGIGSLSRKVVLAYRDLSGVVRSEMVAARMKVLKLGNSEYAAGLGRAGRKG